MGDRYLRRPDDIRFGDRTGLTFLSKETTKEWPDSNSSRLSPSRPRLGPLGALAKIYYHANQTTRTKRRGNAQDD